MLQRVRPAGGQVASLITRATVAAGIEALRPRPGRSSRPARPDRSNRRDQIETRFGVVCNRAATAATLRPSSRNTIMLARSRSRTPIVVACDRRRSSAATTGSATTSLIVSDEPWPPSERLDGRVLFVAADQCAAAQAQGVSSARRRLGQLFTSLVSTSFR